MAEKTIIGWGDDSSGAGGLTSAGGTQYWPLGGGVQSTELWAQFKMRGASTLSNMRTRVLANTLSTSPTTLVSRINGASGNLTVSVGSSVTGAFNDLTHTDTIAAGDLFNFMVTPAAAGTGSMTFGSIVVEMDTTGQTFTQMFGKAGAASVTVAQNATTFFPYVGKGQNSADNIASWPVVEASATISDAQVFVKTNTASGSATLKSRKNGADGNILISITAASTGLFEDTTHTDSVVAGDLINFTFNVAAGTGSVILTQWSVKHTGSTANRTTIPAKDTNHFVSTASQTLFGGPWAAIASLTSAPFADLPFAATVSGMTIRVNTNTRATASTVNLRKSGSNANQTISITASTTGQMSDATHTDTYAAGDSINFTCATGTGAGNLSVDSMALIFQAPQTFNQSALGASSPTASFATAAAHVASLLVAVAVATILRRAMAVAKAATTSPSAGLSRSSGRAMLSASAPIAALARTDVRSATASSAPTATSQRAAGLVRRAAAAATAILGRLPGKLALGTTNPVAQISRADARAGLVTTAPVASLTRAVTPLATFRANASAAASLVRQAARSANANASGSGSLIRATGLIRRATTALVASLARSSGAVRRASSTPTATLARADAKPISSAQAPVASTKHDIAVSRRATASAVASAIASAIHVLAVQAAAGAVASLLRAAGLSRQASASAATSIRHDIIKIAQAQSAPVGKIARANSRALFASTAGIGSRTVTVNRLIAIAISTAANLARASMKPAGASAGATASLVRMPAKPLAGSTSPVARLSRSTGAVRSAATAPIGSVAKQTGRFDRASTAPAASLARAINHRISAVAGGIGLLFKHIAQRISAVAVVIAHDRTIASDAIYEGLREPANLYFGSRPESAFYLGRENFFARHEV